jgi:hypothetical protein
MPFDVTVTRPHGYVRFDVMGETSLERFVDLISAMAAELAQHGDVRVLVDLRGVIGRLSTAEQILIGQLIAGRIPRLFKLASLVPLGEISGNSERAANNKGLVLKVFSVEASAIAWLADGQSTD